ncbi:unnamed protein product [Rhizophagus irregularis]|nr:unnamed protein product [Rhizophagus irregularis]
MLIRLHVTLANVTPKAEGLAIPRSPGVKPTLRLASRSPCEEFFSSQQSVELSVREAKEGLAKYHTQKNN